MNSMRRRKKTNYKKFRKLIILLLLILFIIFLFFSNKNNIEQKRENNKILESQKKIALCLKKGLPESEYSLKFNNLKDEIINLFKNNNLNYSFYYKDLNSNNSLYYNENSEIYTASIIKAPVAVYIYDLASKGEIDLDEKLTYTSNYYTGGTGTIRYNNYNTKYTIRTLVEYSIKYSDNIAHKMLVDRFGMSKIKKYWDNYGNKAIFANGNYFPNMTAKDGYIVMNRLMELYESNDYGKELMDFFKASRPFFVTAYGDEEVAHKYGWSGDSLHDMAIAFNEKPYILIVFTKRGNASYSSFFKEISEKIEDYHNMYYSLLNDYCNKK